VFKNIILLVSVIAQCSLPALAAMRYQVMQKNCLAARYVPTSCLTKLKLQKKPPSTLFVRIIIHRLLGMLSYHMSSFYNPKYKERDKEGKTLLHLAAEL